MKANWVPHRQDIIWIDCNPQVGQEMKDIHPFLVLSPANFNDKTSLVIGLPITTAAYNEDNPFAVCVGKAHGKKVDKNSYVLCHQPKSFDWRMRLAKPHPIRKANDEVMQEVLNTLNQIIMMCE